MSKYIAVFDIPDDYVIGCAVAKICPDDGKVREDKDFENAYAHVEKLIGERAEVYEKYEFINLLLEKLGVDNCYSMPSFWYKDHKDYKVIPTKYHKGYQQALMDIEKAVKKQYGFEERRTPEVKAPF